jgi:hypothetical protein
VKLNRTSLLIKTGRRMRLRHRMSAFVQAAGIAILLFAYADTASAEQFGRWFFSEEERRTLDDMRDADVTIEIGETVPGPAVAAPVVDVISFDGKVERSDGGSTVWVNGRPVFTGNRTAEGIRVQPSRGTSGETRFVLPPSDTGTTDFSLKAGQKVAVQNGRKFEVYEARPGEDAENVLDEEVPADPAAKSDAEEAAGEVGAPAASPGS